MDHGGHDAVAIDLKVDDLIPEVHGGDPLDRLAVARADYLIALVHFLSLLSLDGYIISEDLRKVKCEFWSEILPFLLLARISYFAIITL